MPSKKRAQEIINGFYPIIDVSYAPGYSAIKMAEEVLASGVSVLQLRQKNLTKEDFLKVAQEIYYLKIHNQFSLIINHFVDVAKEIQADGVHLTSKSCSVERARKILGLKLVIGCSVHSVQEGIQKEKEGADYLTFGAIYPTTSHPAGHPVQGIKRLKELVDQVSIPVVAIGGITLERLSEIKKGGAKGFGAISPIYTASKPSSVAQAFNEQWI